MEIRWLGHSAFEIITEEGLNILIDPFISNNPACQIPVEEFNPDIILVTHGHSDHLGDAMELSNKNNVPVAAIHEISLFLSKHARIKDLSGICSFSLPNSCVAAIVKRLGFVLSLSSPRMPASTDDSVISSINFNILSVLLISITPIDISSFLFVAD